MPSAPPRPGEVSAAEASRGRHGGVEKRWRLGCGSANRSRKEAFSFGFLNGFLRFLLGSWAKCFGRGREGGDRTRVWGRSGNVSHERYMDAAASDRFARFPGELRLGRKWSMLCTKILYECIIYYKGRMGHPLMDK